MGAKMKLFNHSLMLSHSLCFTLFFLIFTSFELSANTQIDKTEKNLFERIGGIEVLEKVVDETVEASVNNPKTQRSFKDIKLKTLKKSIVQHLCHLTGGGCVYEGESMKKAHADAKITSAEFEVFVEIFRASLGRHVGTREKNELLKILAPMKRDIVGKPPTNLMAF